ncbi:hypothetical protein TBLA_0F00220 [Henningerozyma blattae CBS 6284]|uniref:General negative regulator of transcription subunit 1 n=1 Tax=Henningerozyma blattae (strain ATCC 34711 / CBS 6284 / DSM 70876 / NBRC 10599 / NRRL Y-10934 / UCD 77-7) TaxID=1071380 RepID=I2H5B4_HENB6|nr:hypothetical protein TBLA_0F00220 [Tetrapisispora blattae CBS 6284]CCH61566.1 hypothetical protein TBLA_0F00220 [Tetrapisispora blattae CBS 6284]
MQLAPTLSSQDITLHEKEAVRISISQISLLIISLSEENFISIERQINHLLDKSPIVLYFCYWSRLLSLTSQYLKSNQFKLNPKNLTQRLLINLFEELSFKSQEFIIQIVSVLFKNNSFQYDTGLTYEEFLEISKNLNNKLISEKLFGQDNLLKNLHSQKENDTHTTGNKMNNTRLLINLINQSDLSSIQSNFIDVIHSLEGENLNEMIALLLSEILSPNSQNVQNNTPNNWFTPDNIVSATKIGVEISAALKTLENDKNDSINWNRIFNLMSTKYFLNIQVKPTIASLSTLFASLSKGPVIDDFFSCDWNISFKLNLAFLLHQWSPQNGCYDLLSIDDMKTVTDKITNSKHSLVYLMSIATLDIEIFLLRDELNNHALLPYFLEFFFEDFSVVPELLAFAVISSARHFVLLIESKAPVDELIITLLVQVFEKAPTFFEDLIKIIPDDDKLVEIARIILSKKNLPMANFFKSLEHENKLEYVINKLPFSEAFEVLPSARKAGWKGFEQYISDNLNSNSIPVILHGLDAQSKLTDANTPFRSSKVFDLAALHFLINKLINYPLAPEERQAFETLQFTLIIAFPRLINFGYGHDEAILANGDLVAIPTDIEKDMQNYLQKMYSGELAIKDIIDILRKLRDSDNPRDQDVFSCMTHAVLAESTFFKDYPLEALATTSVLFGSMILFQLLRGYTLDVALRIIANFAKEGPDSKMFKFAIQALYALKIRLIDLPQYCRDLLSQAPGLQTQPQVYQAIKEVAMSENAGESKNPSQPVVEFIPLKYFTVDKLNSQIMQQNPPKEVTEKVLFVVNNMTLDNFDSKVPELQLILGPNYFSWFSNYLVNQRAKTEPNNHKLYAKIIVYLDSDLLHEFMVNTTYRQLFIILATKDISSIDKNHLRNLSSWLGCITLGINKPILHKHVAMRELLLESYHEKRLDLIVPFVTKVLQNAADSKIFKPPNPWTVGILKILLELNKKANWKLSLTFEVEVLMKTFKLPMDSIEPTNYLNVPDIVDELAGNLNKMSVEQHHLEQRRQIMLMQQYQQHMMMSQQRQQHLVSGVLAPPVEHGPVPIDNTPSADNPFSNLVGSTIFVTHPDLRRVFQMAIAKSVRELLLPAVEKSSSIAVITTSKIVLKDFATEPDEMKLKAAAVTMVRQLAQSLARATSLELLKESTRSTTQSLAPNLMNMIPSPMDELDKAINDNIGLALALIEKASMDKATQDIAEQMGQAFAIRHYHIERRSDKPFLAQNTNPYSLTLPEPLGLNRAGVTQNQFALYESFGKMIPNAVNPSLENPQISPQQPELQMNQLQQPVIGVQPLVNNQTQQVIYNIRNESEHDHRMLVHLMDSLVAQIKENAKKKTLSELGEKNQIKDVLLQILTCIAQSAQKDQLAMKVAQAVVNSLFATSESPLCREVLSLLLEKLCSLSIVARKDVVWWLVYSQDNRKLSIPVIKSLLDVHLITVLDLDEMLVNAMSHDMENSVNFSLSLLDDLVLSDTAFLMQMDFVHTIQFLSKSDSKEVSSFLKNFSKKRVTIVNKGTRITQTEKYYLVFTEWVKLVQKVDDNDPMILAFIKQLIDKGVISSTDGLIEFLRASLELSVFSFKESDPTGEVFTSIDAIIKLIIKLFIMGEYKEYSRKQFLNLALSVVMMVFSDDHEKEENTFNERPYFRLFSNLLCEWQILSGHQFIKVKNVDTRKELIEFEEEFYNIIAKFLHTIQPIAFPGFSFAWITLISHRMFLPIMLRLENKSGWKSLTNLLIDLIKFMEQYTDKNSIPDAISVVYKGALRVFLGISNDVPEYLIENHYELMNYLPPTYLQLKNVILGAIPKKMMIPNPYDPDLSMENIESCQQQPNIFYNPVNDLKTLKKPVDNYLRIPSNSLLRIIIASLFKDVYERKNGIGYEHLMVDSKLIRAIILHVGIEVGIENERTSSSAVFNTKSSYYSLLFNLINNDTTTIELKYQIIHTIIEQLRYPNIQTYWFNFVIINLFVSDEWSDGNKKQEIQELILRNILERIIVNKPHCWGIIVLVMSLLKSSEVDLLSYSFIKEIPEVENMFQQMLKHFKSSEISTSQGSNDDKESPESGSAQIVSKA